MAWFNRSRKKQHATRVRREVTELLDNYADRATVAEGDRLIVNPQQILHNIHARMERIDLDPDTDWAPAEIMSLDETAVMFDQFAMGEMVVTQTARYARQILARWPAELVAHALPPEARIEMFLEGTKIDPADGDIARQVLNRALASPVEVDTHPELDDLDPGKLVTVWLALVFWFGIKSGYLHKWERGEIPK